jgi:hypothetical protein
VDGKARKAMALRLVMYLFVLSILLNQLCLISRVCAQNIHILAAFGRPTYNSSF